MPHPLRHTVGINRIPPSETASLRGRWPIVSMLICLVVSLSAFAGLVLGSLQADEKKEPPVIKAIAPLGIVDGTTAPLIIRGFRLADITDVKFPDLKTAPVFKIKSKGAAPAAGKVPVEKVGDTQLEIEMTLPIDSPAGMTTFYVVGPNGKSEPRKLMILDSRNTITEKEPNDGFSEAQEFTLGQTITGILVTGQNTDVFRFTGQKGQRVKISAVATLLGSPLDPFILLHNADGKLLAEVDDATAGTDPTLEFTLLQDGPHFVTIRDAHEVSSPVHAYLLKAEAK